MTPARILGCKIPSWRILANKRAFLFGCLHDANLTRKDEPMLPMNSNAVMTGPSSRKMLAITMCPT